MSTLKNLVRVSLAAVLAIGLAACGGGGTTMTKVDPGPDPALVDPGPDPALGAAQTAAATAAIAADTAAGSAQAAVMAQDANQAADPPSYAVAKNAAMRARAAATAAMAASDAAAATDDTGAAQAQQAIAEAKQAEAVAEQANAGMYAGMVADAHQANLDEIQRLMDVADARTAAMTSYMAADADATKADMAATEAETTAPGSPGAATAREAATAARTAAEAAMAAHDAIMDGMTKADADAQAAEAATQAGHANAGYMTAMNENDDIQTTGSQIAENNRLNAVTAARKYGGAAADNAMGSATGARTAATAARSAANTAMGEYMRAKSARTNSAKAKEAADDASAAYAAANTAAGNAHTAYMMAKAAVDGVMDDTSLEDANTARDTAEAQEGVAAGHMTTAMMKQTDAEGAETKAMMYADMHVVGLLMVANASHITTAADPDAQADETEVGLIERNRLNHVAAVNLMVKTAADDTTGSNHGGLDTNGVVVSYPYGDEGDGVPAITVNSDGGGDGVSLVHAGPGDDTEAGTDDDVMANFVLGPGLGDFPHEKYIGTDNRDADAITSRQRVILFTDVEQASAPTEAESVTLTNEPVSNIARITPTAVPVENSATNRENGTANDFDGTYDHDGDSDTAMLTGTFDCVDPNTCRLTRTGTGPDGAHTDDTKVTSISGYRFTGSGTTAAVPSMEDDTWLAFGIWLTETVVADNTNTYAFGAFADGVDATENTEGQVVTGKATYQGKAAGVHSTATAVDFFHGDATLTADFGTRAANGLITGRIHDIESGGDSVTDSIYLYLSDQDAQDATPSNITDAGGFSGRARMGAGTLGDDGEYDYPMNGTWTGSFYNPVADVGTTTAVMEDEMAPGSAAGTFSVSRGNDATTTMVDETESYVGAFGAHCSSATNCGDH